MDDSYDCISYNYFVCNNCSKHFSITANWLLLSEYPQEDSYIADLSGYEKACLLSKVYFWVKETVSIYTACMWDQDIVGLCADCSDEDLIDHISTSDTTWNVAGIHYGGTRQAFYQDIQSVAEHLQDQITTVIDVPTTTNSSVFSLINFGHEIVNAAKHLLNVQGLEYSHPYQYDEFEPAENLSDETECILYALEDLPPSPVPNEEEEE